MGLAVGLLLFGDNGRRRNKRAGVQNHVVRCAGPDRFLTLRDFSRVQLGRVLAFNTRRDVAAALLQVS